MSADNSALAAAAARIAALETQLTKTQQQLAAAQGATQAAQQAQAVAQARAQALQQQIDAGGWSDQQAVAALQAQLAQVTAARDKACADFAAVNAKFEALYGAVQPGIVQGPAAYITPDNQQFSTLAAARVHLLALKAGVSDSQAAAMLGNAADIVDLLRG